MLTPPTRVVLMHIKLFSIKMGGVKFPDYFKYGQLGIYSFRDKTVLFMIFVINNNNNNNLVWWHCHCDAPYKM